MSQCEADPLLGRRPDEVKIRATARNAEKPLHAGLAEAFRNRSGKR